jgi:DNA-binding MarR family transcriptional regulator
MKKGSNGRQSPATRAGGRAQADLADFQLDNFFPHLINRATGIIRADFESRAKPFGINIEKWRVLVSLLTRGPQKITTLARLTTIEVPTMSYLLKRMIRAGLIVRNGHHDDGRVAIIDLTKNGRALALRILPIVRQYEMIAFAGFTAAQIRTLKAQLRTILHNLESGGRDAAVKRTGGRRPTKSSTSRRSQ